MALIPTILAAVTATAGSPAATTAETSNYLVAGFAQAAAHQDGTYTDQDGNSFLRDRFGALTVKMSDGSGFKLNNGTVTLFGNRVADAVQAKDVGESGNGRKVTPVSVTFLSTDISTMSDAEKQKALIDAFGPVGKNMLEQLDVVAGTAGALLANGVYEVNSLKGLASVASSALNYVQQNITQAFLKPDRPEDVKVNFAEVRKPQP